MKLIFHVLSFVMVVLFAMLFAEIFDADIIRNWLAYILFTIVITMFWFAAASVLKDEESK